MASCSSLLSCSICLDVFINPVTTPCGHSFCKTCITNYWDSDALCQFPMCRKNFKRRPVLSVNTTLRDVVEDSKIRENEVPVGPGEVACDFCPGRKRKALKSCFVCLTSHCETHLEPHQRIATLKRHKLIDPEENLEDRMCKKHGKPLELFCRTDQACVCQFCTETDHKTHDTVPLEEKCEEKKNQMKKTEEEVQQMIQERLKKVQEIKLEISNSQEVFTALQWQSSTLVQSIKRIQTAAETRAEGFTKELEKEITELKERSTELEQLSHSEDHFHVLQRFRSLRTPPHTKDWSEISVHSDLSVETMRRAMSQLEDTIDRLSLREKPQKVGVFVDYEEGEDSFYDAETRSHIHSFTGCTFTDKLYPYFSPAIHEDGKTSAPLTITPVSL